ncbi:MAG: hypothetical protein IPJ06_19990 [Saprospiraceae bacterium]|nr:hypothetical protein [Saprospiraceae bacterium]
MQDPLVNPYQARGTLLPPPRMNGAALACSKRAFQPKRTSVKGAWARHVGCDAEGIQLMKGFIVFDRHDLGIPAPAVPEK